MIKTEEIVMATLRVRNIEQAALFQLEIVGQLSDGMWENSTPREHWRPWCKCNVVVNDKNVGRDFWAPRDRYALASKSLLDVVGKRMLTYVKLARKYGIKLAGQIETVLCDLDGSFIGVKSNQSEWYRKELETVMASVDIIDAMHVIEADTYTMRDLRRDLNELRVAMQTSYIPN